MFHHQSMRNDAKHFFRRKKSCILGTPLGEFWRSQNYWSLCPKFRKFSNLVKILQCFLRCSLCSNVSLNITNSYYNEFLCLVSSKNLPPKIKIPDIWDAFWVIGFDLIQILNISLDFKYSRVLSLCSAQSFHHHKWSWISIVSMFGSQDLPRLSTPVWQMWGRRLWWLLKSKFPSLISLRTWEIAIAIDLSSMRVCSAKRNSDQKIKFAFRVLKTHDQVEILRRVQDSWEERIKCRDEMKTQELKLRLERIVWGRNFVGLRLRLSLQNLLRVQRFGERSWGECWFSILGFTNIIFLERLKQWLRIWLCVPTLHDKRISSQVVERFCFMADLLPNEEVLRTHSLAAAF